MIEVSKQDEMTYAVTVSATATTRHRVTLSPDYHNKLTGGTVAPETLIQRSFEFLLERESNSAILAEFDLPLIGSYFPEYEAEIRKRLQTD